MLVIGISYNRRLSYSTTVSDKMYTTEAIKALCADNNIQVENLDDVTLIRNKLVLNDNGIIIIEMCETLVPRSIFNCPSRGPITPSDNRSRVKKRKK